MNYDNMSCGDLVRFAKSRNDYSDKKLNIYEFTDNSFYKVDEIKNIKIINQSNFGLIISRKKTIDIKIAQYISQTTEKQVAVILL